MILFELLLDLKNAHIIFKEILHKDSKNIEAILNYSGFLIKNECFIDAKLLLEKAIIFYHKIPGIWTNLGILYYEEDNFLKSIECDENSIKIDPKNYIPYYNIGRSYYQLGKYKKSIQYFEKSLKINSKHSKSYFNLGLAFDKIGAIDLAVKAVRSATMRDSFSGDGIDVLVVNKDGITEFTEDVK